MNEDTSNRNKERSETIVDTVGYKKPPRSRRFTKGKSGNPAGRPKGTRNLKTDVNNVLNKKIRVKENGKEVKISRQEAILLSLFEKGVHGDVRAISALLAICQKLNPPGKDEASTSEAISEDDKAIIEEYLNRTGHPTP